MIFQTSEEECNFHIKRSENLKYQTVNALYMSSTMETSAHHHNLVT
jgi:hypothetical protein